MTDLPISVFSDFTCPFSYVTEAALRRRAAHGGVELRYRAVERFPAPAPLVPPADEPDWQTVVRPLAAELGLALRAPAFRPRTGKAHEAARFAAQRGVEAGLRDALFAAYWAEERDIGRIDVLLELIAPLGVDPEELKIALDIDRFRDEVLHDQALARQLRVARTPTVYFGTGTGARVHVGALSPAGVDAAIESR